ncbi:Multidrug and toxin extrusion protein 1 [Oopsacas minuta]|uniref:Multidrug and toxin extrusion protein n=1 Tax=Oopsacas minuta TaxID=111878 RepID=A0AAV7JPD4_9METZ|nr:Multidrug and toxin extrusion protein 1 [Oopsacas minuta]
MQFRKIHWILEEIVFLFALALPTSIECFTEGLQMKLSNIFIGRTSGSNVALMLSSLFIGQVYIGLIAYPIAEGFGVYVNVLCSQAYGAKQYKQVGLYFYRALFMSAITCIPVFTILISIRPIVYLVFQDWELAEYSGSYTDILCFGYPAYLYYKIGIRFLQALNIVWGPVLYLLIGITLNGIIQYILIFQYNTSMQGAAAGYVISNYLIALLVFSHIQLSHVHKTISHEWSIELISDWYHTARYAVIGIVQYMFGTIPNTIIPLIFIGTIAHDQKQLAIYSILYSVWWVCYLTCAGFSSSITVRIAHLLGANQPKRARNATIVDLIFAQFTLVMCNIIVFVASEPLSYLFTTDPNFAKELTWNIRMFSFVLSTDIKLVIQGVMNACCKQGIQIIFKFIFQIILGTIFAGLIVHFVKWKALGIILQFAICNLLTFTACFLILACSDWEVVALFVSKNTKPLSIPEITSSQTPSITSKTTIFFTSTPFVLFKYIITFVLSFSFLTTVFVLTHYL